MIRNVISELKDFSDNADIEFEHWFNFAVKLGEEVNTDHQFQAQLKAAVDSNQTLTMTVLYPIVREAWLLFYFLMI